MIRMSEYYKDSELQNESHLILCITERDMDNLESLIDNRMFIGHWTDNTFFIKGKRENYNGSDFVPYSLICEREQSIFDFVKFACGNESNIDIVLYNFNNLKKFANCDDMSYEFFEENIDYNYEIAGYEGVRLDYSQFIGLLRMLKHVTNNEN